MKKSLALLSVFLLPLLTFANEANLVIPSDIKNQSILYWGFLIIFLGIMFGLYQFVQVKKLKAHKSMLDVAQVIYETCKTYLKQQGRFLMILFVFIGAAVAFYYGYLSKDPADPGSGFGIGGVLMILGWTVVGILGSYSVA